MRIVILETAEAVTRYVAEKLSQLVESKSKVVLGLATGSTPMALYRELERRFREGTLSLRHATTFNLDEYYGLPENHPQSYRSYMAKHLFDVTDIDTKNTFLPYCPPNEDPRHAALIFENRIMSEGGIDLQILGIGPNGHIGFNEPGSSLGSRTRVKTLANQTMLNNSRFFERNEMQPELAITVGIATILDASQILLLATGSEKAEAIHNVVEGPLSSMCPGSALQLHKNTTVVVDLEASKCLRNREYYTLSDQKQRRLESRFGEQ